mmetsp:Transcript_27091/g.63289  ORF Transcript_27091/g.63289 Transcript_27091/m.63289 type:complete len:202 (-) Transcript_27091:133-738(-)
MISSTLLTLPYRTHTRCTHIRRQAGRAHASSHGLTVRYTIAHFPGALHGLNELGVGGLALLPVAKSSNGAGGEDAWRKEDAVQKPPCVAHIAHACRTLRVAREVVQGQREEPKPAHAHQARQRERQHAQPRRQQHARQPALGHRQRALRHGREHRRGTARRGGCSGRHRFHRCAPLPRQVEPQVHPIESHVRWRESDAQVA